MNKNIIIRQFNYYKIILLCTKHSGWRTNVQLLPCGAVRGAFTGHNGGQGCRGDSRQLHENSQGHPEHKYKGIWKILSHNMYSKFQLGIVLVEDE